MENNHAHISWPIPWRLYAYMMAQYHSVHDANDLITNNEPRECVIYYLIEIQANMSEGTSPNPHIHHISFYMHFE